MLARFRPRPSYANVAATLALFLCLSGTAWAVNGPAPGIDSVGTSDIINQEVKSADIKPLAVGNGKLAADAVTAAKVLDNSLTGADINESTLSYSGGPCPSGKFVRNLSLGALTCGPTGSNAALGDSALIANDTGLGNSAVGANALEANTEGSGNSALGVVALYANTTGSGNSAVGDSAMVLNTEGSYNTAIGTNALAANTTANGNSAVGLNALNHNTEGVENAAVGMNALLDNDTGDFNVALGNSALLRNETGGSNTALGDNALEDNTTGTGNTALGASAGDNVSTGSNNVYIDAAAAAAAEANTIRIGDSQTRAFLAGVSGVTTVNSAAPVLVDNTGQLGTTSSSRRFKRDIRALAGASDRLMKLRPVSFRYRNRSSGLQYGLIAEQVARVYPNLVVDGADGRPDAVAYQQLPALLLAKVQEQEVENRQQDAENRRLKAQVRWLMRHARLR